VIKRSYFVYVHRRADTGVVFYIGKGTRTPLKQYIRSTTTVRRNIYWRRIVAKTAYVVEVLADFFSEADAFEFERAMIAQYRRSAEGGTLCNLTDGGEGHSGLSPSESTRAKVAARHRGKPKPEHVKRAVSLAQRGVPNPPEQRAAHSLRMSGARNPNFGKKNSAETIAKRVATRLRNGKCAGAAHPFYGKKRPEIGAMMSGGNAPWARRVVDIATGKVFGCIRGAAKSLGRSDSTVCRWLNGKRRNPSTLRLA